LWEIVSTARELDRISSQRPCKCRHVFDTKYSRKEIFTDKVFKSKCQVMQLIISPLDLFINWFNIIQY